jgi:hypothetical protein
MGDSQAAKLAGDMHLGEVTPDYSPELTVEHIGNRRHQTRQEKGALATRGVSHHTGTQCLT